MNDVQAPDLHVACREQPPGKGQAPAVEMDNVRTGQTIVNVPDATIFKPYVDDEPFYLPTARLRAYTRVLDVRVGTLTRELIWATPGGKHVRVRSCRVVSLEHRHLIAMTYEVTLLDHAAPVAISSQVVNRQDTRPPDEPHEERPMDPRLATLLSRRVLRPKAADISGGRIMLCYHTATSRMTRAVGADHVLETECAAWAAWRGDQPDEVRDLSGLSQRSGE